MMENLKFMLFALLQLIQSLSYNFQVYVPINFIQTQR